MGRKPIWVKKIARLHPTQPYQTIVYCELTTESAAARPMARKVAEMAAFRLVRWWTRVCLMRLC